MTLNDHTPSQASTPNYSLIKVGTLRLEFPWSAITCEQMVFGKRQKRQVVVGKVTATLNGQQMAHPGPGHLHHSANAKEGPLALELGDTPFKTTADGGSGVGPRNNNSNRDSLIRNNRTKNRHMLFSAAPAILPTCTGM